MQLKLQAQKVADTKGVKLNTLLNYFLRKFVENPDVVQIQHDIEMEKIFDQGIIEYCMSPQGKKQFKEIDALLKEKRII
jgi:hypothetical protein